MSKSTFIFSLLRQPFAHRLYEKSNLTLEMPKSDWLVCNGLSEAFAEPGEYEVTVQKRIKKRSLDANAFAWVLIGKLAEATSKTTNDIYMECVREQGTYETILMIDDAVEGHVRRWERQGLGWQCETQPSKIPGCTTVFSWYGTSVYDSKEMSTFIDTLLQECEQVGIYVDPTQLKEARATL